MEKRMLIIQFLNEISRKNELICWNNSTIFLSFMLL